MWKFEVLHFKQTKPKNYWLVQNGFMEKLICNKNLALSAKAPPFLSKAYKGSEGGRAGEGPGHLQQQAFSLPLLDGRGAENRSNSFIKHCLEASLRERRALQVFYSTDLLRHGQPLRVGDGSQLFLLQFLNRVFVVPEVKFSSHQDDGGVGTVVSHFRVPLCSNIFKWRRTHKRKAN